MKQYLSREICLCQSLQSAQFCPESARGSQGRCLASQHLPGAHSLAPQGFAPQTEAAGSPLARRGTLPPFPGCGHAQHLLHPPPVNQSRFLYVSPADSVNICCLLESQLESQMCYTTALNESLALETNLLAWRIATVAVPVFGTDEVHQTMSSMLDLRD